MEKKYAIEGMTCMNCVRGVTNKMLAIPKVLEANIQLEYPQATLKTSQPIALNELASAIGKYKIHEIESEKKVVDNTISPKSISTYKPLIIIVSFIAGVSLLSQYPFTSFDAILWMRHFMAGFFIVFSFFKLLNISGFAKSYAMYDIVAERIYSWGYIYPFIELGLGILYLINAAPVITNVLTISVLGVSSIGVIRSNLRKEHIKCACLGDVFNLPMSTVTIIEDVSMIFMAILMLFYLQV